MTPKTDIRATLAVDDIMLPSEAAHILGVPASTVTTWIHRYKITPVGDLKRPGDRTRKAYDFNDIARCMRDRRPTPNPPPARAA